MLVGAVVIASTALLPAAAAQGQQTSAVVLDRPQAAVGETVQATGSGWSPGGLVQVEMCGNNGLNGSPDCAVAEGATVAVAADGTWTTRLLVWTPPKPCPCIVRARSVDADASVSTPFLIAGATQAPPVSDGKAPPTASGTLLVSDVHLTGGGSPAGWFGAPQHVTLALRVTNTGSQDLAQVPVVVRSSSSSGAITVDAIPSIPAGGSRALAVQVPVRAGQIGAYTVSGEIGSVPFTVRGSSYPWVLLLVAFVLVELLIWWLVRLRRRRRALAAADAPLAGDEPVAEDAPAPVADTVAHPLPQVEAEVAPEPEAVPVPVPVPVPEAVPSPSGSTDPDWSAIEGDLAAAVQPAVERLLAVHGPVTRAHIDAEAEAAVRPIVVDHDLDEATSRALSRALADEMAKLPLLVRAP